MPRTVPGNGRVVPPFVIARFSPVANQLVVQVCVQRGKE